MSIIQQLEDLKEWAQNPERYERRLAFRSNLPSTEAGTIPPEFDELSDREVEYYKTGPWSTREDYRKGQLVQPRQGFYRKGFVKQKPTAVQLEIARNFYKKPFHELDRHQKYNITSGQTTGKNVITEKKLEHIEAWEETTGKSFKKLKDKRLKSKIRQGIQTGEGRGQVQPTKGLSKYSDIELNKAAKEIYGVDSWKDPAITVDRRTVLRENLRENKGKFVKPKGIDYEKRTLKDAKRYFNTVEGKQLKWIADNGKKYVSPTNMMNAFEKEFGLTNMENADLFKNAYNEPLKNKSSLSVGQLQYNQNQIEKMIKGARARPRWSFTPGYSEGEIFKISIINNNPNALKNLKTTFAEVDKNFKEINKKILSDHLTVDEALQTIGKKNYKILNDFDLLPGTREIKGGLGGGRFKDLLTEHGISQDHINSYKVVIQPIFNIDDIVLSLSNEDQRKKWGLTKPQANAVQSGWKNVSKGYAHADDWIKNVDKVMGDKKFREIFGSVNFDHTLAKEFGKNAKYLPRDYLLRGKYTTGAFNRTKLILYDAPMMNLIKDYEKAGSAQKKIIQEKIKTLHNKFNASFDDYVKDFQPTFDKKGKFEWKYSKPSPFAKKTVHKYDISPQIAQEEIARGAVGFKEAATFEGTKGERKAIGILQEKQNKFLNLLSKNIDELDISTRNILAKVNGCPVNASSGGRIGFSPGGVVDCLKSKLNKDPKLFLQNMGSAAVKTKNTNFLKFLKGARTVAKGTGIFALWEAAFAPLIMGWMATEGESWERMKHDLSYGPILEALGVSPKYVPGKSEKEELKEHMGETGFNVDQLLSLFGESKFVPDWDPSGTKQRYEYIPGERDWLVQELNEEINRSANIGGKEGRKSYKQFQIEQQLKKLDERGRKLVDLFYEGPAGQYFDSEKWMAGEQARTEGLASLEAAKAANLKEYREKRYVVPENWWDDQMGRRYAEGGIVSLLKKK